MEERELCICAQGNTCGPLANKRKYEQAAGPFVLRAQGPAVSTVLAGLVLLGVCSEDSLRILLASRFLNTPTPLTDVKGAGWHSKG